MHTEHIGSCRAERFCFLSNHPVFAERRKKPVKKAESIFGRIEFRPLSEFG